MPYTFSGGVDIPFRKDIVSSAVIQLESPAEIRVPLRQHGEEECIPTVQIGERVRKGQEIGRSKDGTGCPIHSGISGIVRDIVSVFLPDQKKSGVIVIENDYEDRLDSSVYPFDKSIQETTPEQILKTARLKGILGSGWESLPLYRKIEYSLGKVQHILVNCTECEPFLSVNYRLVLEQSEKIIGGAQILLKALGVRCGHLVLEDCFSAGLKVLSETDFDPRMFRICLVKRKYPQSDPRLLVSALFGTEIPLNSSLADSGYAVFDATECVALYDAFVLGMPMVERVVTVGGNGITKPSNLSCPIGTPLENLLKKCDPAENCTFLLTGGLFSGIEISDVTAPLVKNIPAVLAFAEAPENRRFSTNCVHCGRCVSACPMKLLPLELYRAACKENLFAAEKYFADCCSGCGCCSFVCPVGLNLTDKILEIREMLAKARNQNQPANNLPVFPSSSKSDTSPKTPKNAEKNYADNSSDDFAEHSKATSDMQAVPQSSLTDVSEYSVNFVKKGEDGQ